MWAALSFTGKREIYSVHVAAGLARVLLSREILTGFFDPKEM